MNRIKILLLFVCTVVLMTACKKDDPKPSVEEQQLQLLTGTWKASSVKVDGTSVDDQYKDFVLTIFKDATGTKLVATNGAYAFPSVGVDGWSFVAGTDAAKIKRSSDQVEMTVKATETELTIEFTVVASSTGGRVGGLEGHFVFVLVKS